MSIAARVMALRHKSAAEMRELHDSLFEQKAPITALAEHLRPKVAYRIQELAFGGLPEDVKEQLDALATGQPAPKPKKARCELLPGTRLCREWQGVTHEVEVGDDGFTYQGQKFRSLSGVARKITGTHWNGHLFFKLRADA